MKNLLLIVIIVIGFLGDRVLASNNNSVNAEMILGNSDYMAMSYSGYRHRDRNKVPTVADIKEDMKILSAMGIKLIRTYDAQLFDHAINVLKAIRELKNENPDFEMYVMQGVWIDCKGARTDNPDHSKGDFENNSAEIKAAIKMAQEYPDIVKIIAVGNEAMVHWAASYFVTPDIILRWVNHLQDLKTDGQLPTDLWITSSDNFASWGGGGSEYHTEDLVKLIKAVDFISLHSYPFHDSHYNPDYWLDFDKSKDESKIDRVNNAMLRARSFVEGQVASTKEYLNRIGVKKAIHIGETGWATKANKTNNFYGAGGSGAADEYKEKLFYDHIRQWSDEQGMSVFYFEAFDEPWKDSKNPLGTENHFGLFTVDGKAKYALWNLVDNGIFDGLTRGGKPITKTYNGSIQALKKDILPVTDSKRTIK